MKLILYVLVLLCSLVGCTPITDSSTQELSVIATTTMLADLVHVIGSDCVQVTGLMGAGIDPHLYQASAGDLHLLEQAHVVVYHGLGLEGKLGDVLSSLDQQGKSVIRAEDGVSPTDLLMDDNHSYDPHIWFDASLWGDVATHIAYELAGIDPENADTYHENLTSYLHELNELEQYIIHRVNQLPESQRVLITAHDAFGYFGHAYGFEVLALQGLSTQTETSTAQMSALAHYITDNQINAIFVESSVSTKGIQALQEAVHAYGFSVDIGGELYSDSLGDATSGHESYLATFTANVDTIINGLT